jgi:hypothetical protein
MLLPFVINKLISDSKIGDLESLSLLLVDFCEVQVPCHGTWTFKHTDFFLEHRVVQCVSETRSTDQTYFSLNKWKLVVPWYKLGLSPKFVVGEEFDVDGDQSLCYDIVYEQYPEDEQTSSAHQGSL